MNKFNLITLSTAFCLAMSTSAIGASLSKDEYKAARDSISAKYKSDKAACDALAGNAEDVCNEQAKGDEKIAQAELEARNDPSDSNRNDLRIARADAAYEVAKEKCDDFAGNAKDVCVEEAKSAHVAARADAKVSDKNADANAKARKTNREADAKARETTAEARKEANVDKHDAAYAVAKEKCDALAGDTKDNCIKEAKITHGQN